MRPNVRAFVQAALVALKPHLPADRPWRVLEVGSYQVEPGDDMRPLFPEGTHYTGIDMRKGPGVDLVLDVSTDHGADSLISFLPKDDDRMFDLVLCLDTLEHAPDPVGLMRGLEALRDTAGHVLLAVPFALQIHAHPNDYWRFTQEGLKQLDHLAGRPGVPMATFQDPSGSLFPHLVCAIRSWEALEVATQLDKAEWRTGAELLRQHQGPCVTIGFTTPAEVEEFQAHLKTLHDLLSVSPASFGDPNHRAAAERQALEHLGAIGKAAAQVARFLK